MIFELRVRQINEDLLEKDLLTDYLTVSKELLVKLDPTIRTKFSKKGFSILENIYAGLDTEYVNIDALTNKLLSVQLSVNSKILVQIPTKQEFEFMEIDVLSGRELNQSNLSSINIKWDEIRKFINQSINRVRKLKFGNFDRDLEALINGLKTRKGEGILNSYIENNNRVTFIFERSRVKQYYKECSEFSFYNVVKTSYQLEEESLQDLSGKI